MTVLIVTNTNDPTVDFATKVFSTQKVPFVRLNTDEFLNHIGHDFAIGPESAYRFNLGINNLNLDLNTIRSIWLRRPEDPVPDPRITNTEAKKHCVIEANYLLKCMYVLLEQRIWVSHPKNIAFANVKLHQLEIARASGLLIPRTVCTNDPNVALAFIEKVGPTVVKPFKSNTVETDMGTAVIYTSRVDENSIKNISAIRYSPTLLQEEIKKVKEYRVTIIGERFFVTSIDSQSDPKLMLDWRNSSDKPKNWSVDSLPDEIIEKCYTVMKAYSLNYGAFDFALTPDGDFVFFELNPNGQWAWQEIYLGLPMTDALIRALGF